MHNSYSISTLKTCTGCEQSKPLSEFYNCKSNKDGKQSRCIVCTKAYGQRPDVKARRREYMREYVKGDKYQAYLKRPEVAQKKSEYAREYMREYMREYKSTERMEAANAIKRLIANGTIPHTNFTTCADCGKTAEHYHHPDYSEPENVIALCALHHKARHRD